VGAAIGLKFLEGGLAAGAVAAGAAMADVPKGVGDYLTTTGPGWLTGMHLLPTPTVANTPPDAGQALALKSGVKPWVPKP
jgi:hypothetical protein